MLAYRSVHVDTDGETLLELHCRINYESETPLARKLFFRQFFFFLSSLYITPVICPEPPRSLRGLSPLPTRGRRYQFPFADLPVCQNHSHNR